MASYSLSIFIYKILTRSAGSLYCFSSSSDFFSIAAGSIVDATCFSVFRTRKNQFTRAKYTKKTTTIKNCLVSLFTLLMRYGACFAVPNVNNIRVVLAVGVAVRVYFIVQINKQRDIDIGMMNHTYTHTNGKNADGKPQHTTSYYRIVKCYANVCLYVFPQMSWVLQMNSVSSYSFKHTQKHAYTRIAHR